MPNSTRRPIELSGLVATLRFVVEFGDRYSDTDKLVGIARERRGELIRQIDHEVKGLLGQEFDVVDVIIREGSLVLIVVLGAAYSVYMGFSRYESFVKSFNLLISQIAGLLRRFFVMPTAPPVTVGGSWQPGTSMIAAESVARLSNQQYDPNLILLYYLILSHAVLVGVLVWIVIKHLK